MRVKFWLIVGTTLLATLLLSGIVLARGESSQATGDRVRITVAGQDTVIGAEQGDVIYHGNEIDGECINPDIAIQLSAPMTKVRVGMDGDCNLVVQEVAY